MILTIGTTVRVKDTYLDEDLRQPLTGTIKDVFSYPDYRAGSDVFVVMFDHDDPTLPGGGEFSRDRLEAAGL